MSPSAPIIKSDDKEISQPVPKTLAELAYEVRLAAMEVQKARLALQEKEVMELAATAQKAREAAEEADRVAREKRWREKEERKKQKEAKVERERLEREVKDAQEAVESEKKKEEKLTEKKSGPSGFGWSKRSAAPVEKGSVELRGEFFISFDFD